MIDHSKIDNYHVLDGIPAMTSGQVHAYLEQLGKSWTGQGSAMELGCWLGASSVALLKGLTAAGYNKAYWAFDAWQATRDQIPKAKAQGIKLILGEDLQRRFQNNVQKHYGKVVCCKGNLPSTLGSYDKGPIEFCLFDAPKTNPTFTECIKMLSQYWIPGVTVLGLLDYHFYLRHAGPKRERFKAPVNFMEQFSDNFTIEKQWDDECVVFFRYMKEF